MKSFFVSAQIFRSGQRKVAKRRWVKKRGGVICHNLSFCGRRGGVKLMFYEPLEKGQTDSLGGPVMS